MDDYPLLYPIHTMDDAAWLIQDRGFVPLFDNALPGYDLSIEELCLPSKWFGDGDGPWEWKGPLIRETGAAYGKLFRGKAGFVSAEWFADFANMRSEGLAFDERYEYGLATRQCRVIVDLLDERGPMLTRELRRAGRFGTRAKGGLPGFEGALSRLQMWGYVVVQDIEYAIDRSGNRYGWGMARMALADQIFPFDFYGACEGRTPDESRERILEHLCDAVSYVPLTVFERLIG